MRYFVGQFPRTRDDKGRIQIPAQFRDVMNEEAATSSLYVTLGEHKGTLALYTVKGFEKLAERVETEFMTGQDAHRFELQFYGTTSQTEMDKQGRLVLPDTHTRKARLGTDLMLVGQKNRIEIWNRAAFEGSPGIDWEGDDWPEWQGFLRRRPASPDPG